MDIESNAKSNCDFVLMRRLRLTVSGQSRDRSIWEPMYVRNAIMYFTLPPLLKYSLPEKALQFKINNSANIIDGCLLNRGQ